MSQEQELPAVNPERTACTPKYEPRYTYDKDFVLNFIETINRHRFLSAKTFLSGLQGWVLMDFAYHLGVVEDVLDRYPKGVSDETINAFQRDLVERILEKIGK